MCSAVLIGVHYSTESTAYADVIEPGIHRVAYSFSIANVSEFGQFVFFGYPYTQSFGAPTKELVQVTSKPVVLGRWHVPKLYSISQSNWDEPRIKGFDKETLEKFVKDNPQVVGAEVKLSPIQSIADESPLVEMHETFSIVQCDEKTLVISPKSVTYRYRDGSIEILGYEPGGILPQPKGPNRVVKKNEVTEAYQNKPPPANYGSAGCAHCSMGDTQTQTRAGIAFLMLVAGLWGLRKSGSARCLYFASNRLENSVRNQSKQLAGAIAVSIQLCSAEHSPSKQVLRASRIDCFVSGRIMVPQ